MSCTFNRLKFLISCKFKEHWARQRIKEHKKTIKIYKYILNTCDLCEFLAEHYKRQIRLEKISICAWKKLLTNYKCPFDKD